MVTVSSFRFNELLGVELFGIAQYIPDSINAVSKISTIFFIERFSDPWIWTSWAAEVYALSAVPR